MRAIMGQRVRRTRFGELLNWKMEKNGGED